MLSRYLRCTTKWLKTNAYIPVLDRLIEELSAMNAAVYERLFLLNRCLEQAAELLEQFTQDGLIYSEAASDRRRIVEELRTDLNYFLTGMLHRKELEESIGVTQKQIEPQAFSCAINPRSSA
jgi:hypothetical protein